MKILIKNFGPIHEFEFDLEKDLHVIYGENSIGKSYISYVVYLILKNLQTLQVHKELLQYGYFKEFEAIITGNFIETKKDITKEMADIFAKILQKTFIVDLQNSLKNTFGAIKNLRNEYQKKDFEICLINTNNINSIIIKGQENKLFIDKVILRSESFVIEKGTTSHSFYVEGEITDDEYNTIDGLVSELTRTSLLYCEHFFGQLLDLQELHFLPCSRSGLYIGLSSLTPILAELSQNRALLKNQTISLPSLSEPIADYYRDLVTLNTKNKNKILTKIALKLEEKVLKGAINYNKKTNKIEYHNLQTKLQINIEQASSMISELAPLILFLKHIIGFKRDMHFFDNKIDYHILFIEEPEAHLHPKIQVQLMEIFAELTKVGVKVVMTTHSNYMFNKLSNMLLKKEIEVDKVGSYHLVMTDKGSVVNPDMQATEEGMEDHNFVDTAEELYNERLLAYETLNATTH